jgi:hypothetical protein
MLFPNALKCLTLGSLLLSDGVLSKPVGKFGQLSRDYKSASRQSHGPIQRRAPDHNDDDDDEDDEDEWQAPEHGEAGSSMRFLNSQTSGMAFDR